jgi:hypothetical protein
MGGPQGRCGWVRKIPPPIGIGCPDRPGTLYTHNKFRIVNSEIFTFVEGWGIYRYSEFRYSLGNGGKILKYFIFIYSDC